MKSFKAGEMFSDFSPIDIPADAHIRQVFSGIGLCPDTEIVEQVKQKVRVLYHEFPGMMDMPCRETGKTWCKAHSPLCDGCYMKDLCLTAGQNEIENLVEMRVNRIFP